MGDTQAREYAVDTQTTCVIRSVAVIYRLSPASAAASIVLGTWGHLQTDFAHVLGAVALPSFNGPLDRVGPLMRPLVRAPQRLFEQEIDEADSDDLAGAYSRFLSAHQLALAAIDEEVRHVPIAADFMSGDGPSEKVDRWLVSTLQSVLNERLDRLDSPPRLMPALPDVARGRRGKGVPLSRRVAPAELQKPLKTPARVAQERRQRIRLSRWDECHI